MNITANRTSRAAGRASQAEAAPAQTGKRAAAASPTPAAAPDGMDAAGAMAAGSTDHAHCYAALAARDARFDGAFFTGVKTTGIYCRPVCPAKTPRANSCTFFPSAAAAEAAGFRPCLRCRPELAPYALQANLAHAVWQRIAAGALNDGDIEALAVEVGLSSRQLRRVLQQQFGVSPVELAQTQRLLFAKKLLQETHLTMAEVAFAAGFGSVRRFNTLFAERYRMAPGALRRSGGAPAADRGSLKLRLAYRPPLDWPRMLAYLAARAIPGVEAVDARSYARTARYADRTGELRVTHDAERAQLVVELSPSFADVLMPLLAVVRRQFDLDANPAVIEAHLARDPLLAERIARSPGLRVPGAFDTFELAVRAVLGQQVSVAGATTLAGRLVARFGTPAGDTPGLTHHFPAAAVLAQASPADIAALGMPGTRAQTIQAIAQFTAEGGLAMTPATTLSEAVERLRGVRGIGEWTAQYIALRALRYPDAFPAGDLALQKAAAPDGGRLSEKQLLARAREWAPWRGYAALALWHG